MTQLDEQGRPEPPANADEKDTLLGFLEFQRATFAWKCEGLDTAGLTTTAAASSMTLGGMMKHLALVEDWWFSQWLAGEPEPAPWDRVDWDADPDWEWHTAAADTPEELLGIWRTSVARSRERVTAALAEAGMDQMARRTGKNGFTPNLRWIVCHMIEEYARHNGHADLIREAVDGSTGE